MLQADSKVLLEVMKSRRVDLSLVALMRTAFQLLRMCIFFFDLLLYYWSKVDFQFGGRRRELLLVLFGQELIDVYVRVSPLQIWQCLEIQRVFKLVITFFATFLVQEYAVVGWFLLHLLIYIKRLCSLKNRNIQETQCVKKLEIFL